MVALFAAASIGVVYAQCCSSAASSSESSEAEGTTEKPDPVVAVTDATFSKQVLESTQHVVVDFWASWCPPCMALKPIYHKVAADYAAAEKPIKFVSVDVDENRATPTKYGIRSIPTLIMFKDGKVVETRVGGMSEAKLKEWTGKYVK
ncbi:MAG TPA: thioredoxin [Armatimonadetes bacterium]|nr:thioredoxin [Armatimonadota bacterium]